MIFKATLVMVGFSHTRTHECQIHAKSWAGVLTKLETEPQYDCWEAISIEWVNRE
jgi:hypothetical protein